MAESLILAIPQIEAAQGNKNVTHNNAVDFLEQSANARLTNGAIGAGPWTLTEDQFVRNVLFVATSATGDFNFVTPTQVNGVNSLRLFVFLNLTTNRVATVKAAGAGTTVIVQPGGAAICHQVTDDIVAIATLSVSYDLGLFVPGQPGDAATVLKFVTVRPFTLPDNFAGSTYHNGANPSGTVVFDVKKNGASVGSISVTSGGAATFNTTGGATSFVSGDRLEVVAPTPQDGTLADVSITFLGVKG